MSAPDRLLAIETSTPWCSVAVSVGERVLSRHVEAGQRHAEMALGLVDELLREAGLQVADLEGISFGAGPGSFTGLRIACGLVQGLALSHDIPVIGVSTLEALAEACAPPHGAVRVISCLDARMGEVYHAAYERTGTGWHEHGSAGVCAPGAVPLPQGTGWIGCGSGFGVFGGALAERFGARLASMQAEVAPTASAVLRLARTRFERGEGGDAASAAPIYLRDKVALTTRERAASAAARPAAAPLAPSCP